MSLTGDVNTLALADLVQVSALNLRTCRIHVIAPHAEGDLFLERGSIVHAYWGDLVGAEAVYAMLNTPDVGFHVRGEITVATRTVAASWQQLVLEAARRQDHNSVPQPSARKSGRWHIPDDGAPTLPRLRSTTPAPLSLDAAHARKGPPRALWLLAAGLVTVALGLIAGRVVSAHRKRAPAIVTSSARVSEQHIADATELTGPGDAPPTLLAGDAPAAPRSDWAVAPTIVCRLTIASDGSVRDSRVYRSRLELAAFEDAALAAVAHYRFAPARKGGVAVAAAINWPVSFVASDGSARPLRIKGSDTIGGALGPALGRAFHARRPDIDVTVEALGSKTAFVGLFDGSADIGASSRPVEAEELEHAARLGVTLRELVVAYDGIAVIVNPQNQLAGLTVEQAAKVFSGEIHDWSELGGAAGPISVITRPSYSGTRSFFRDKVLRRGDAQSVRDFSPRARVIEDNGELVAAVAADAHAVAFVGHGWLQPSVRALPVDGVLPSASTIRDGSYPIYRPLLFYTRGAPSRDVAAFLSFVLGADGQRIVREQGFVPLDVPTTGAIAAASDDAPGVTREPLRVGFATGGARLTPAGAAQLAALARQAHGASLLVVGHSDAEGDPARNHRLALARAERVAAELVARGVPAASLSVESDDADAPLASNASSAGRRLNRRADVFLLPSR